MWFFFSSRRRHTRCALVTGVQTCALPISRQLTLERATNTMIAVQRATLDNLYEAVVVYGSDGRLSLYNRAFSQLWQIDPDLLNRQPHLTEVLEAARPLMQRGPGWAQLRERLVDSRSEEHTSELQSLMR